MQQFKIVSRKGDVLLVEDLDMFMALHHFNKCKHETEKACSISEQAFNKKWIVFVLSVTDHSEGAKFSEFDNEHDCILYMNAESKKGSQCYLHILHFISE